MAIISRFLAIDSFCHLRPTSLLQTRGHILSSNSYQLHPGIYSRNVHASTTNRGEQEDDVVIVGGGIAGLATAVSLHKLGIRSLVLEQADSLRTSGTSLTLNNNGWKALDFIGIADELRSQFLRIQGLQVKTETGKELLSTSLKDQVSRLELRAVERKVLLQKLADQLPPNTIRFSSKLSDIERAKTGETNLLQLVDGTQLSAKVVIGCDGIRSPVAKWMGFREPKYSGHCAFRGLGVYPEGQPYEPIVNYMYGKGVRAGYVPISPTKIYWFIVYNDASYQDPRTTPDPSKLRNKARDLLKNWPTELHTIMENTPDETITRTPLQDRWLWPVITPSASTGRVVVAGDAWHPMTPNLGQGGCCALEDAIVLSHKISDAIKSRNQGAIETALRSYEKERWSHVFKSTIRSNLVGALAQSKNKVVSYVRDKFVIPKLIQAYQFQKHAN